LPAYWGVSIPQSGWWPFRRVPGEWWTFQDEAFQSPSRDGGRLGTGCPYTPQWIFHVSIPQSGWWPFRQRSAHRTAAAITGFQSPSRDGGRLGSARCSS